MATLKKEVQINLLPEKGFGATTAGRVLAWMLTTFRVIAIVIEIIVVIALISRFWLDTKNANLNELVEQKQAVIASYSNVETEFKSAQERLRVFSELTVDEDISSNFLDEITKNIPPDIILSSVHIADKRITINAASPSEKNIQQFIVNLESSDLFKEVVLLEVGTSQENKSLLVFKLSVNSESNEI